MGPALDRDVVFFSSVDFTSHAQRPQAVAAQLVERGARVLYVDNLGLRVPRVSDWPRVQRRLRDARGNRRVDLGTGPAWRAADPAICVTSPIVPPLEQYAPVRRALLHRLQTVTRRWRAGSPRDPLVWTYLPNPVIRDLADSMGIAPVVYEYADLASERLAVRSLRHRARVAAWEQAMFDRAAAVFSPSPDLLATRGVGGAHAFVISHGAPEHPVGETWPELSRWPSPRIAFVGSISHAVDRDLVASLARARPGWAFLLVGPHRTTPGVLADLPNVWLAGERPQTTIPGLLAACDVGIVPYDVHAVDPLTVSPLKVHDYLAAGLPVVSVEVAGLPASDRIEVAAGVDGFLDAIERALVSGRRVPEPVRTWSDAVDEMIEVLTTAGIAT